MTEFCALSHAESARHIAPSLAVDQRQAVMLNQVGGEQHRGVGSATARNPGVGRLSMIRSYRT